MPRSSEKSSLKDATKLLRDFRVDSGVTSEVVEQYLESLDCPRALSVCLMFRHFEHEQLVKLVVDPLDYNSPGDFRDAYCATKLLSKADFLKVGWDRKQVALQKFSEFEGLCRDTNRRFRNLDSDPSYRGSNVWLLHATRRKISQVLGDFNVLEVLDHAHWGPGVTNTVKGVQATGVNKFQREAGITRDLYSLVMSSHLEKIEDEEPRWIEGERFLLSTDGLKEVPLMAMYPLWFRQLLNSGFPRFEVGNTIVTVPKDAKADRVICVEPGINLWFQLGIGEVMSKRLRKRGVDLRSQEVNQWRAKHALVHGLATVDFSSASDSISLELVRELLPPDWFEWMNASRSHFGVKTDSDEKLLWAKFSSMGNGFTFPLESLIFYCAAKAVAEYAGLEDQSKWINAYGDDVIIPSECFHLYSGFCKFLGFVVNHDKSFYSGPFRESCGSHYYLGVDVKPVYLKQTLTTPLSVYKLANGIRALSHRVLGYGCDRRFLKPFVQLVRAVPKSLRFRIPLGKSQEDRAGDGGFVSNLDEANPPIARDCIEGYMSLQAVTSPERGESEAVGMLLYRLSNIHGSLSSDGRVVMLVAACRRFDVSIDSISTLDAEHGWTSTPERNTFALRGRTSSHLKRVLVHKWYDLGPWI